MTDTIPESGADFDGKRITERPDGFYWQSVNGDREHGPFPSLHHAIEDMSYSETNIEVDETLEEAESEIGVADWIDPDTGQPAEESIPHIDDQ